MGVRIALATVLICLVCSAARADVAADKAAVTYVDTGKAMRLAGILTADLGLAVVGTGIVLAVLSKQAGDAAYHPSSGIYDHAADERQTSFRDGDIVCFVIGGVAVGVGTTIWMLGRKRRQTPATRAAISSSPSTSGVAVRF